MGLGTPEILLIVVALFLLFGATRLPQLAKSLGQSKKAFRDGMREAEEEARVEEEQKRLNKTTSAPQLTELSDEELLEEARRRAALKQQQS